MSNQSHQMIEILLALIEMSSGEALFILGIVTGLVALTIANFKQDYHMRTKSPEKIRTKSSRIVNQDSLIEKYKNSSINEQVNFEREE